MPIYEYQCTACGEAFELMLPMDRRDAIEPCPICGRKTVERKQSVFAAQQSRTTRPQAPSPIGGCGHCEDGHPCCGMRGMMD
jgi:putative FmdB family regulatory protein